MLRDGFAVHVFVGAGKDVYVIAGFHGEGACQLCAYFGGSGCPGRNSKLQVYLIISGQHRAAGLLEALTMKSKLSPEEQKKHPLPDTVPYKVLRPDVPASVREWLLKDANDTRTISSESGVLVFISQFG